MRKTSLFISSVLILITVFTACDTSYFDEGVQDFVWTGEVKIPVTHLSITTSQLLTELEVTIIEDDSEGNLIFKHSDTIHIVGDDIKAEFPEINMNSEIATPDPIIRDLEDLGVESYSIPKDSELIKDVVAPLKRVYKQFSVETKELTYANFDKGNLNIKLNSSFDYTTLLTIVIPTISSKNEGTLYSTTVSLSGNSVKSINIPLNQYNADFTYNENGENTTFNSFYAEVSAVFLLREGNVISKNSKITFETSVTDIGAEIIYGDFKQEKLNAEEYTIHLESFDKIRNGTTTFTNSSINLKIKNGFGFPIGIDLYGIKAFDNGVELSHLTYTGVQQDQNTYDSPNKVVLEGLSSIESVPIYTNRIFDKTNSNANELISTKPSSIVMSFSGNSNPIELSSNKNFYSKNNKGVEIIIDIDVPLHLKIENLIIEQDNIDFVLGENVELIDKVTLEVTTINNIPLSGKVSLQFFNNGIDLDVSKTVDTFDAAQVNDEGLSIGTIITTTEILFSNDELEKLKEVTHVKTAIIFDTPIASEHIKLLATNYLETIITAKIGVSSSDFIK